MDYTVELNNINHIHFPSNKIIFAYLNLMEMKEVKSNYIIGIGRSETSLLMSLFGVYPNHSQYR